MRLAGTMGSAMAGIWLALAAGSTGAATFDQNPGMLQGDAAPTKPAAEVAARIAVPEHSRDVLAPLLVVDPVDAAAPAPKSKPPVRSPAPARATVVAPVEIAPTGAEIVGKSLSQGPSDPNVPLPHPNLTEMSADRALSSRASGTRLFGRADPGDGVLDFKGGLFGLTVPIPADRNAPGGNTRYSPGLPTLQMGSGTR